MTVLIYDYSSGKASEMGRIRAVDGRAAIDGAFPTRLRAMFEELPDPSKGDVETLIGRLPQEISGGYLRAKLIEDRR